jgi:hypothetical protein
MGNLPKITKWRRNGDPDPVNPDWAGHTNGGKKENGQLTTQLTLRLVAPCVSLPSKFVVFSPNGEMEKGASASALDITSRDETDWHTLLVTGPGDPVYITNP